MTDLTHVKRHSTNCIGNLNENGKRVVVYFVR